MIKAIFYYGQFAIIWYFCILLAFIGLYGFVTLKSSFRKLASLMLLLSAALPTMILSGRFTEDMNTAQAMVFALLVLQTAIAAIGLSVIKRTIPLKIMRTAFIKNNAAIAKRNAEQKNIKRNDARRN